MYNKTVIVSAIMFLTNIHLTFCLMLYLILTPPTFLLFHLNPQDRVDHHIQNKIKIIHIKKNMVQYIGNNWFWRTITSSCRFWQNKKLYLHITQALTHNIHIRAPLQLFNIGKEDI